MLEDTFKSVYLKFKLHFYRKIFSRFETREASLTAVETFCVEVIHAMGKPTVNEFAKFVRISQANAAYKVQSLIKKGYVKKERSPSDRREYFLVVTERFYRYYGINTTYIDTVICRIKQHFSPGDMEVFERVLKTVDTELMPELEEEEDGLEEDG